MIPKYKKKIRYSIETIGKIFIFVHTLVSYWPEIILVVALWSYQIGTGGMPGGIDDHFKVFVAIAWILLTPPPLLHPPPSCPAPTVAR